MTHEAKHMLHRLFLEFFGVVKSETMSYASEWAIMSKSSWRVLFDSKNQFCIFLCMDEGSVFCNLQQIGLARDVLSVSRVELHGLFEMDELGD